MTVLAGDLAARGSRPALRFPEGELSYRELAAATDLLAGSLAPGARVAVWAQPRLETAVAVVAALRAGAVAVPINPKLGPRELEHVTRDCEPAIVLAAAGEELPGALARARRVDVDPRASGRGPQVGNPLEAESDRAQAPGAADPAVILYTSGTTGPPKGAVLSQGAIAANLDALADAWAWTGDDTLAQGLPLFHVHGLVLGILGPLRRGGAVHHVGRFSPEAIGDALDGGASMLFAVPTMYHRLADSAERAPALAAALRGARLLVSGSAALPAREHARIEQLCGQRIVERYGLTETQIICAVRHDGDRRPGHVGPPLAGVELRLLDDEGIEIAARDGEAIGEVAVRGPNLFGGYLNSPDATAAAMRDGWFMTGDMAVRAPDGYVRIVGRRSTDLIKTGGYRVGAGEVEAALLEHPGVAEAAVLGLPDDDLGERIAAWVVTRDGASGAPLGAEELSEHVASLLTPHKRPREVRFVEELPRNAMGKVRKAALRG